VLSGRGLCDGADHSSRWVLPTVVRRCVWSRNLVNEEALAHWGLLRQKQTKIVNIPTGYGRYNMRFLKQQLQTCKTEVEALTRKVAPFWVLTLVLPTRSVCQEKIVQDEQNFVNRKNLFVTVFKQVTFNTLQKPLPINKAHTLILGLFNDAVSNVIQYW